MARRAVNAASREILSDEFVEAIADCRDNPLRYVMLAFPWGEKGTALEDETGPDVWQVEYLNRLGDEIVHRGTLTEAEAVQMAVASGHGVGKSALVSWVILWFMSTREDPAIVTTANTQGQLMSKTWPELRRWHRLAINADWFQWTATKFYLKERPETWAANAIPWTKERSEAFAGLHAKHVLVIFDEASAIDDSIWTVTEGAMTTSGAMWLAFGNPTRNTGRFRECWTKFRHRWATWEIDSRKAKKANQGQIRAWIEDYGEDSDFVRVRVRGLFPRSSSTQLIPVDTVEDAIKRFNRTFGDQVTKRIAVGPGGLDGFKLETNQFAPKLLMVDVARFGADQSVIGMRQGRTFIILAKYRELGVDQLAYRVIEWIESEQPDAVFVDGGGVGGGVVDLLRAAGHDIFDVVSGAKALDDKRFYNRRAEMWWKTREWLRDDGRVQDDKELSADLIGPEYGFADRGDRIQIESKEDMKARGLASPDSADCLAMSFYLPIAPREARGQTLEDKIAAFARGANDHGATTWKSN